MDTNKARPTESKRDHRSEGDPAGEIHVTRIRRNPAPTVVLAISIGAVLLGMNGCADIQKIGFVPWSQAAARFQQAYNACHEDKPCREKAWADYHAELVAISSEDDLNSYSPDQAAILSSFNAILK